MQHRRSVCAIVMAFAVHGLRQIVLCVRKGARREAVNLPLVVGTGGVSGRPDWWENEVAKVLHFQWLARA